MNNLLILSFALLILIATVFLNQKKPSVKQAKEVFQIENSSCMDQLENQCYNDPLTLAKCWATKAFPCPKDNGSYMQCTNNYPREVNIADCLERSYYYSSKDERLSEKCVYGDNKKLKGKIFPFALKKDIPDNTEPSIFPRVNMWRNDNLQNNFFVAI